MPYLIPRIQIYTKNIGTHKPLNCLNLIMVKYDTIDLEYAIVLISVINSIKYFMDEFRFLIHPNISKFIHNRDKNTILHLKLDFSYFYSWKDIEAKK